MITKKNISLLLLFATVFVQSQTLVLEEPQVPSPEKELLYFLQENLIDLNLLKGKVIAASKEYKVFDSVGKKITSKIDALSPKKQQNIVLKQLPFQKVIDQIGIDSIVKVKKGTYDLFRLRKEETYTSVIYELKDNKIVAMHDNTPTYYYTTKYTYNKKGLLIRIEKTDDYEYDEHVIKIVYNKRGKVLQVKKVNNSDGTNVEITNYTYENELLTKVETTSAHYFFNQTDINIPVEDIVSYDKYEQKDTYKIIGRTIFKYNAEKQLLSAETTEKGYSKAEGIRYEEHQRYVMHYERNKIIVNAFLPEKRQFVFTFDTNKNPIQIDSYVTDNRKWLHKQTLLNIKYKQ